MRLSQYSLCLAALASTALGACSSNKLIDNFSGFANKTNSLGAVSGDDKSMTSIAVSGSTLSMTPKAASYFYENFACENAASEGFGAVSFTLSGPAQASLMFEMQTRANCNATTYKSSYKNVTVPAASSTVTINLKDFEGANLGAITSFTWNSFNKTGSAYTLGNVQFVCQK